MKYLITILFVVFAIVAGFKDDEDWKNFKKNHKRTFKDDDDEKVRYDHFKRADDIIKKHNEKFKKQEVFYKMGHNEFSDKTEDEISKMFPSMDLGRSPRSLPVLPALPQAPAALSYQSYALPVQNQGGCGSCWAFATAAQYEMQIKRKYPNYNTLISPQRLLDCVPNGGCGFGGDPQKSLNYMYYNGFVKATSYPYLGYQQPCWAFSESYKAMTAPPVTLFLNGNEEDLKNVLASVGPVVIGFYTIPDTFVRYDYGVYWDISCPSSCSDRGQNHAMVAVGYGTDYTTFTTPVDYWLVKNSFGTEWGEGGYVKLIRNYNNCNIGCIAFYSIV